MGVVLLPGTAFLELVLHAGGVVGCAVVRELVLEAPLVLGEGVAVQIQVVVGEPERVRGAFGGCVFAGGGRRGCGRMAGWMRVGGRVMRVVCCGWRAGGVWIGSRW